MSAEGYVTVEDGVRLFYQIVGRGSNVLVVLNGFYLSDDFKYLAESRTVLFLDLRNRGRSDYVTDDSKLKKGVLNDIEDIEAVRRHFGWNQIDLLGHSYAGKTVMLYAMKYAPYVNRVVQIGAMQPDQSKKYPPHLTGADKTLEEFFAGIAQLQQEAHSMERREYCERFWTLLRVIYVADPANAGKIHWDRCDLPTELHLMKYWLEYLQPSIERATPTPEDFAAATMPVLIVHGVKDRSSPYGGAKDWAATLPNARLLSVDGAAHAPWIEAPEVVLGAIKTFFDGS
jgi:proline iminopeptidase